MAVLCLAGYISGMVHLRLNFERIRKHSIRSSIAV
jgi:hypothetical protein